MLVLDELASWFNARSWNDKTRQPLIDWFIHARKYHWDVILLVQDVSVIDKQLREMLCEHLVICRRLDRITIPLISPFYKFVMGKPLYLPKAHVASVYYGDSPEKGLRVDRWWYRGKDLYKAYMTGQVFTEQSEFIGNNLIDMRATYSMLSPWHLIGRYKEKFSFKKYIQQRPSVSYVAGVVTAVIGQFAVLSYANITQPLIPENKPVVESSANEEKEDHWVQFGTMRIVGNIGRKLIIETEKKGVLTPEILKGYQIQTYYRSPCDSDLYLKGQKTTVHCWRDAAALQGPHSPTDNDQEQSDTL